MFGACNFQVLKEIVELRQKVAVGHVIVNKKILKNFLCHFVVSFIEKAHVAQQFVKS